MITIVIFIPIIIMIFFFLGGWGASNFKTDNGTRNIYGVRVQKHVFVCGPPLIPEHRRPKKQNVNKNANEYAMMITVIS